MIEYRGEKFSGYNKPKITPGKVKAMAVLAKKGDKIKLVRFGDPNATPNESAQERKSYVARHAAIRTKTGGRAIDNKLSPAYWSLKHRWKKKKYD